MIRGSSRILSAWLSQHLCREKRNSNGQIYTTTSTAGNTCLLCCFLIGHVIISECTVTNCKTCDFTDQNTCDVCLDGFFKDADGACVGQFSPLDSRSAAYYPCVLMNQPQQVQIAFVSCCCPGSEPDTAWNFCPTRFGFQD